VVDDEVVLLDVVDMDMPGQEEYGYTASALREQFMRTGEGFLLVYSITSRSSFEQISTFYQEILRAKGLGSFPVIVAGNKCDLEHERQVSMDGKAFIDINHALFYVFTTFSFQRVVTSQNNSAANISKRPPNRAPTSMKHSKTLSREIRRYNKVCLWRHFSIQH